MVKRNQVLREFLLNFLVVFCNCIPHYIHDEIFKVCEIIVGLTKNYLKAYHIEKVLSNLVDKYTMKSKAYKSLLKFFLEQSITISQKQYDKLESITKVQAFVNQEI